MTLNGRRLAVVGACLAILFLLPASSAAQCGFDYNIYVDGDYENIDEENVTLYGWGATIDYSSCQEYCFHVWGAELSFVRIPDQVTQASYSFPGMPNPGGVDASTWTVPGEYQIQLTFYIGCYCSPGTTGYAQQSVQAAPCKYPPIQRRGVNPGTVYRYIIDTDGADGLDGDEAEGIHQAANRWTSTNSSSGLNASFSTEEPTGRILRIEQGDPTTIDADALYAATTIQQVGGYSFAADTIMNADGSQVFGTPGFRRIYLHELGHFHGLAHSNTQPRSTVMRTPLGASGSFLPDSPTSCDQSQALVAGSM